MDQLINVTSKRFKIDRTRSEKISFFLYVTNLFACILFGCILLVWVILAHLAESGVFDRGEFSGIIKRADIFVYLPSAGTSFGDVSWIFLVVFALFLETLLVIGLYGAICVHRRRSIIDDFPDKEPKASVCFIYILRISIVICLALGGMSFVVDSPIRSHMSSLMESAISGYGIVESTNQNIIDVYQNTFQCCGRESRRDWIQVDDDTGIVRDWTPQSCCIDRSDCFLSPENIFTDVSTIAIFGTTTSPVADTSVAFVVENSELFDFNETFDRGCDEAIQSWLTIHGLLLFTIASVLFLLHTSWMIWRRNARLSYLLRGCCEASRRNRVKPICLKIHESSTDSNTSLVFSENGIMNAISSNSSIKLINAPSLENNHAIVKMPELPSVSQVHLVSRMMTPIDDPLPPIFSTKKETESRPKTARERPKSKLSLSSGNVSLKNYFENSGANLRDETRPRPPTPAMIPPWAMRTHGNIDIEQPFTITVPELDFPKPVYNKNACWATSVKSEVTKSKRQNVDDNLSIVSLESFDEC
ncbi:uncharacterized protein LOC120325980 [Styela clava]